jgi:membrane fusion protein (multidrug efflux system)
MRKNIVLISICAVLLHMSCQHTETEKEEETMFLVTSPLKKDTLITRDYVCQIHAIQHIELRAMEKGFLENIFVDEGQSVKKGQQMFQIMPQIYNAELQKAQAETNFAEIEYQNTKQLSEKNVVSPNELALAKAKLDKAKAEQSLAQTHLQFTDIKAPFDGIMDHFQVRLGSLINEGDLLSTLSDNSEMWVYFNVPESEYLNYKAHTTEENLLKVSLLMANNSLFEYPGVVTAIEADFNNETGNIAFRATFPNPKGLLRHGETGNIQMNIPLKNVIIIPQKATYEILEKKYVFVVDKIIRFILVKSP